MTTEALLQEAMAAAYATDPLLRDWRAEQKTFYRTFVPRPDKPEQYDEQASFVFNRDPVSFLVGGNAAGTTEAASYKLAQFVLNQQPPPRPHTPFWIISNTFEQVCGVIWDEKLYGHGHIPETEVDWEGINWYRKSLGWPTTVPLKPWPEDRGGDPRCNWVLEFKSYIQGRRAMQARSIGGFMFSEQFPLELFLEVLRGTREYNFPGAQFAEFTPIEPELCMWIEKVMENPPEGWKFYRANTELNTELADGWLEQFIGVIPEEMLATRLTGALATFEGVIYQGFTPAVHVCPAMTPAEIPPGVFHYRGVDWGASEEHPFALIWAYVDGMGDWTVYDEYWNNSQTAITQDHVEAIIARSEEWGWPGRWDRTADGQRIYRPLVNPHYLQTFADPSRPGEINEFNVRGIPCQGGMNNVLEGIDAIRGLLKISRHSHKPRLRICENCKHLIEEMRKYRWKRGRKPTSATLLNPAVAQPEPLKRDDDTCFAAGTLITMADGEQRPIECIVPGDRVQSHLGPCTVIAAGKTGVERVVGLRVEGHPYTMCTARHQLAESGGRWVAAVDAAGVYIDAWEGFQWNGHESISARPEPASELKRCAGAGKLGIGIQTPRDGRCGLTFGGMNDAALGGNWSPMFCTGRYGESIVGGFLRARLSITQMATLRTIESAICNRSAPRLIRDSTTTSRKRGPRQQNGTDQQQAEPGIESTGRQRGKTEKLSRECVNIAVQVTRPENVGMSNTARKSVGQPLVVTRESMTKSERARFAETTSFATVIERRSAARRNVVCALVGSVEKLRQEQPVYNLATTDGTYFANGILASNCDAMRYPIFTVIRSRGAKPSSMHHDEYAAKRRVVQMIRQGDALHRPATRGNGNGNGNNFYPHKR